MSTPLPPGSTLPLPVHAPCPLPRCHSHPQPTAPPSLLSTRAPPRPRKSLSPPAQSPTVGASTRSTRSCPLISPQPTQADASPLLRRRLRIPSPPVHPPPRPARLPWPATRTTWWIPSPNKRPPITGDPTPMLSILTSPRLRLHMPVLPPAFIIQGGFSVAWI
jgi:hypothetical protein